MTSTRRIAIGHHGFTLLELMISLVLLGLIVLLLFSGLNLGNRSWELVADHSEQHSGERLAFAYLQRSLSGMFNEFYKSEADTESLFSGYAKSLRWVGPTASHAGLGGASLFRLDLVEGDQANALMLTRWLYHPEILEEEPAAGRDWRQAPRSDRQSVESGVATIRYSEHRLMNGVSDLEINYYGSQERGIPSEWHSEWHDQEELPKLIRIRLRYPNRISPPLVITIRASQT
ncbi:MAG: prepilin-type N-terminal cleavage/methylation domain-containing protein [Candidatus Thiodiazotropha sp.]